MSRTREFFQELWLYLSDHPILMAFMIVLIAIFIIFILFLFLFAVLGIDYGVNSLTDWINSSIK